MTRGRLASPHINGHTYDQTVMRVEEPLTAWAGQQPGCGERPTHSHNRKGNRQAQTLMCGAAAPTAASRTLPRSLGLELLGRMLACEDSMTSVLPPLDVGSVV